MSTFAKSVGLAVITAVLLTAISSAQPGRRNPFAAFDTSPPLPGQPAPDFSAYDENLKPIKLADLHPNGILVLQWGCPT